MGLALRILSFCALFLSGCASTSPGWRFGSEPPPPDHANVHSAAYAADGMTFSKPMQSRPPTDSIFYFKNCTMVGNRSYYSKTDYDCSYP